jgi:hypothetical protein
LAGLNSAAIVAVLSNDEALSLVTVAEALGRAPANVAAMLRHSSLCVDWYESLIINTGEHQIAKMTRIDPHERQRVHDTLTALRIRLDEAMKIIAAVSNPQLVSVAKSRATNLLREAHPEEHQKLVEQYQATSQAYADQQPTLGALRLLGLSDETFRDVAARDVQNAADGLPVNVDDLGHYTVIKRWRAALLELGDIAFEALSLPVAQGSNYISRYNIHDSWLPRDPSPHEREEWARRLTFLTHLRVRLVENSRIRREQSRRIGAEVFRPAEDDLRARYSEEYYRYRLQPDVDVPSSKGSRGAVGDAQNLTPQPTIYRAYIADLAAAGWTTQVITRGRSAWLVATKYPFRIVVASRARSADKRLRWKTAGFFTEHPDRPGRWCKLRDYDALLEFALRPPRDPFIPARMGEGAKWVTEPGQIEMLTPPAEEA